MADTPPVIVAPESLPVLRMLTSDDFQRLSAVPPEVEWFANLQNPSTRRAYQNALGDFMRFVGIQRPEEFRDITRAHVIAWRDELVSRELSSMTIRHRLSALASLFEYLCEKNAVTHNPVKGVKRPSVESYEGKTPALGDHQARKLLEAPDASTLAGKRDRAMLATLLYHALRREELCRLKVKDVVERQHRFELRRHPVSRTLDGLVASKVFACKGEDRRGEDRSGVPHDDKDACRHRDADEGDCPAARPV